MPSRYDPNRINDFACSCQPTDRETLDALVVAVAATLKCSKEGLVEAVINDLRFVGEDESIQVDGIYFDMWGAIDASTQDHDPPITWRIRFDDLRHRFALLYTKVREKFPAADPEL